jgi:adenylyltransferase/sulfurtransferase
MANTNKIQGHAVAAPLAVDPATVTLSQQEYLRYSRHLIMPQVGVDGQKRLKASSVLLIGTGGLGSPLALYLAAAGVGRIGLVDFDVVDFTNLQRQIVHGTKDVGRPKIESARETLADLNPDITLELHETMLTSENALQIFANYDIIIDGTDNFPTRYLVNDACVLLGKPNVYGSIAQFEGQATVFWAKEGPCYRCQYPEPPPPGLVPSCAEGGVLGILPGTIGCIQATEAVKLILGIGEPLIGRLLLYDALSMRFREYRLRKDPECPVCGEHPTVTHLIDYEEFCGVGRGNAAPAPEVSDKPMQEITAVELKAKINRGDDFQLVDVREPHEYAIARIPGAVLIPLGQIASRSGELDRGREMVLQCKGGFRSAQALQALKEQGFTKLVNLKGGITAWSNDVDPSVPKY